MTGDDVLLLSETPSRGKPVASIEQIATVRSESRPNIMVDAPGKVRRRGRMDERALATLHRHQYKRSERELVG